MTSLHFPIIRLPIAWLSWNHNSLKKSRTNQASRKVDNRGCTLYNLIVKSGHQIPRNLRMAISLLSKYDFKAITRNEDRMRIQPGPRILFIIIRSEN